MELGSASKDCRMDKKQIAARIDRLLSKCTGTDKAVNKAVGDALEISGEAVRQWRKGDTFPRIDKLAPLVEYLTRAKVLASAQYILFGQPPSKLSNVDTLERIVEEGPELKLLRLFRTSDEKGQDRILEVSEAIQMANPRASNVSSIKQSKKRRS